MKESELNQSDSQLLSYETGVPNLLGTRDWFYGTVFPWTGVGYGSEIVWG